MIVTIFTVLGLGLGFLSNAVVAAKFGAGREMDVYLAATTLPMFIVNILAQSLSYTFIPVFAEYRAKDPGEIWTVVSSFININALTTVVLCVAGIIFAQPIMKLLAPGFTPEKLLRSAELLRWFFPMIIFTVINGLMASVYYSNQRFVIPSLSSVISPLLTIAYVLLFYRSLSTMSLALATLTSTAIQTVLLSVGFFRTKDFNYTFVFDFRHPGVIKILKLMAPLILGMLLTQTLPLFDRYFLSKLPDGSISHIGYAQKFINIIPSLVSSGLVLALFPVMSKYAAETKWEELRAIMSKGVRMLFFMSLPFAVFLGFYGRPVIQLLFERGAFTPDDTTAVYYAFAIYLASTPLATTGAILGRGFFVLQDTKTPAIIGFFQSIFYIGLCLFLIPRLGYLAIPSSYAIHFYFSSIISVIILWYKFGARGGRTIIMSMLKHAGSAFAVVLLFNALIWTLPYMPLPAMMMIIFLSFASYLLISRFVFKTEESVQMWNKLGTIRHYLT